MILKKVLQFRGSFFYRTGYNEYCHFKMKGLNEMFVKTVYINGFLPETAVPVVHLASQFVSDVFLEYQHRKVNVKSIMGLLSLGSTTGEMTLTAKGMDEYEAIKAIGAAFEQNKTRSA